jgi:twitching motility protein PilI
MARRTGLREFQLSVAERLRTASSRTAVASKLGFQVGADNWFVSLHQVSEVVPIPASVPVPLTHSWFRGVANVRGNLYSLVDFSAFQGGEPIATGMERRVILVSERLVGGAGTSQRRGQARRRASLVGCRVHGRRWHTVAGTGPARARA